MRAEFPYLASGEIYLDSATTSLRPRPVLEVLEQAYRAGGSPGRTLHGRGHRANEALERAREAVAEHLDVAPSETVFVPSTTAALNLLARGWGEGQLGPESEILVSVAEHNSNFLPWQSLSRRSGAELRLFGCTPSGDVAFQELARKLSARTRVVALTQLSNVTGASSDIPRVVEIVRASPAREALVVVDGAQGMVHLGAQPKRWGCDAYSFSGHKCYGVPGAGVLWASARVWSHCEPLWVGGGSVERASLEECVWAQGPARYEGGSSNLPAILAMVAGLTFARDHGQGIEQQSLLSYLAQTLRSVPGVCVLGEPTNRVGCVSWTHRGIHAHDVATLLDHEGISIRAGHLCAQRLLKHFGVGQCLRASIACFNEPSEVDRLGKALHEIHEQLG